MTNKRGKRKLPRRRKKRVARRSIRMCADGKKRGAGRPGHPLTDCMTPGCGGKFGGGQEKPGGRGLCYTCHGVASNLVKKGATTWIELEKLGLCQPPYRALFEKAFREAKGRVVTSPVGDRSNYHD